MAVEAKKVLDAIELKFKGKSITKDFKKSLATKWAEKIENDANIDLFIDDREDVILEASAEGDRRATAAKKHATDETVKKITGKPDPEVEVEDDEMKDAPAWAKALVKQNQTLTEKLAAIEASKSQETLQQRFEKDERLKGINPKLLKGRYPKTEEEFEATVTEVAEDLKEFASDGNEAPVKKFGNDKPRFTGVNNTQDKKTPAQEKALEAIKAFTDKNNANNKVETTKV